MSSNSSSNGSSGTGSSRPKQARDARRRTASRAFSFEQPASTSQSRSQSGRFRPEQYVDDQDDGKRADEEEDYLFDDYDEDETTRADQTRLEEGDGDDASQEPYAEDSELEDLEFLPPDVAQSLTSQPQRAPSASAAAPLRRHDSFSATATVAEAPSAAAPAPLPVRAPRASEDAGSVLGSLPVAAEAPSPLTREMLQRFERLSPAGKARVAQSFVDVLARTLAQESGSAQASADALFVPESETDGAAGTTNIVIVVNTLQPYERQLDRTQAALFAFWKHCVHRNQQLRERARKSGRAAAFTFAHYLGELEVLCILLQKIFQRDHVQSPLADKFMRREPAFAPVYQCVHAQPLSADEIQTLHKMVHELFRLAVLLGAHYYRYEARRAAIERMMQRPEDMSAALRSVAAEDLRCVALQIKHLPPAQRTALCYVMRCVLAPMVAANAQRAAKAGASAGAQS